MTWPCSNIPLLQKDQEKMGEREGVKQFLRKIVLCIYSRDEWNNREGTQIVHLKTNVIL